MVESLQFQINNFEPIASSQILKTQKFHNKNKTTRVQYFGSQFWDIKNSGKIWVV